jgi:hypothetical protein
MDLVLIVICILYIDKYGKLKAIELTSGSVKTVTEA